ncbi:hypothetical protein M409DRAFT_50919 [Zasmidium cellare ATCC 36951]|uniref:Cyclase family protein n=1 Tax=Zasmidium cellare ATCC 36951 TaxID=1080233 RepID=A0A6A6CWH3_ZASCE|nr:uncharacterized protein M409DRAFT_50919 [Zasmidium cellare ATCC 36951]KAF2171484.1 hypothetical protein M409DRAFT_50919 [Zasmidium cellare ATCC 36951]
MSLIDLIQEGVRVFDLGADLYNGMPQSSSNIPYSLAISKRHGDVVSSNMSGSNAVIISGDHVGTHIDAICHVAKGNKLHGGVDVSDACLGGAYKKLSADTIDPLVCRGLLLDIAALKGKQRLDPGEGVSSADLVAALNGRRVNEGDAVLVRTGWTQLYSDTTAYLGLETGTPGVDATAAQWLADHKVRAAGGDTISFEQVSLGPNLRKRPVHDILIFQNGIHIIEVMDLEELAEANVTEFLFILSPLKLRGATASPVRPLALVQY